MDVGNKKHIFLFNTSRGQMTVGTDDVFELSSQKWFTSFLGVTSERPVEKSIVAPKEYTEEEVKSLIDEVTRDARLQAGQDVEERARQLAMEMVQVQERDAEEMMPPPLPPEEEVKVVAQEMEQEMQAHQEQLDKQPVRPNIRQDVPNAGQNSFMDITPNNMTQEMWAKLSPDQQTAYGQKYMQSS